MTTIYLKFYCSDLKLFISEHHLSPETCAYSDIRECGSNATWNLLSGCTNDKCFGIENLHISLACCSIYGFKDAKKARECLKGRHIVFIGDSLTRYSYLNLANFIETGDWESYSYPYSEVEGQWGNWTKFYEVFNRKSCVLLYTPKLSNPFVQIYYYNAIPGDKPSLQWA